ncbi:type II toxin-antitoxin system HicB family antitoxin [Aneurinibacillus terranovensis]|uniref:type II toxin-antitoxin system HicB family antitoxin n=1 Tax=Aneurinibacillus terranovensis TaxID=278991 RepID=UPI0003F7903E|nr:toxin-antitoxin system HicB family antitoxin [Aneurinibacillus terranovensis]
MANKDLNYYMDLPYTIQLQLINDGPEPYYYASVLELDGCQSHGDTVEEAYESIREAMEGWLETKLEHGDSIPEPMTEEEYSGKFVVRVPKSLHRQLVIMAAKEGVSLNQYVLHKLSRS